jgi:hypothetical protein
VSSFVAAALLATGMKLVASHAGYADGAPPGFSGGFKEDSCHACHFHNDPNAPPGRVSIDGVPPQFEAGKRYTLTVTLSRSDMKLAGFQLTARFKDGGAQAGTLSSSETDARVSIGRAGAIEYAGQNKAGSSPPEPGVAKWSFDWLAPASGGPVIFHVAANAADGNGGADGDFVYTAAVESAGAAAQELLPADERESRGRVGVLAKIHCGAHEAVSLRNHACHSRWHVHERHHAIPVRRGVDTDVEDRGRREQDDRLCDRLAGVRDDAHPADG